MWISWDLNQPNSISFWGIHHGTKKTNSIWREFHGKKFMGELMGSKEDKFS